MKPRLPAIESWKMNGCASLGALLFCSDAWTGSFYHSPLSVHAFAAASSALRAGLRLPIYPDLFKIFSGSGGDTWRSERQLAGVEAPRPLSAVGWMWVRPGAVELGGRISESGRSLRLIVQNQSYGSNCMDCCRSLRRRARAMGNVSGKTDDAQTGSRHCVDWASFANGNAGATRAFTVSACLTGSCTTGR